MAERKQTGRIMIQFDDCPPSEVAKIYDYEPTEFGFKQSPFLNNESQEKYNRKSFYDDNGNSVHFYVSNIID